MDVRHFLKATSCIGGVLVIAVMLVSYPGSFQTLRPVPPLRTIKVPDWFSWGKVRPLADYDKTRLLAGDFTIIRTFQRLPERLRIAFGLMLGVNPSSVEDPIGALPESCMELPRPSGVRLLFAGISSAKWFVHYEYGGNVHGYGLEVFEFDRNFNVTHFTRLFTNKGTCDIGRLRREILEEVRCTANCGVV